MYNAKHKIVSCTTQSEKPQKRAGKAAAAENRKHLQAALAGVAATQQYKTAGWAPLAEKEA